MKKFIKELKKRQIICGIVGIASFILFLALTVYSHVAVSKLKDQQMAQRWSNVSKTSHVSCFFSQGTDLNSYTFRAFEAQMEKVLQADAIMQESVNAGARMWASCYSGGGEVSVQNNKETVKVKAIGVGGDFFLFHPKQLLFGNLFSGNELMQDYIVIDQDTAWQLFGSNDVAGMQVTIGGVPHIISGVIEREDGHINKMAGNDVPCIYMSYDSLEKYGTGYGINCYEIVMPNPISGYALKTVQENIGVDEADVECVENTTRYDFVPLWKTFLEFGSRSMTHKAIIYPYWENIARGYEDILSVVLLFRMLFLLLPVGMIVVAVIVWWKKRTWNWKDVLQKCKKIGMMAKSGVKKLFAKVVKYKDEVEKETDLD